MRPIALPNRLFFYSVGFSADCFNFLAILAETFLAASVLHATELQMGILGAASALGYAVPSVWAGLISERLGRRNMVLFAVTGMLASYLVTPYVGSMQTLYAVSFARSLATSCLWAPMMAWMAELSESGSLSGMLGGYNVSWASGILVGFWLAGWSFEHLGYAAPFHIAAAMAAATLLYLLLCVPKRAHLQLHLHEMAPSNVRFYVRQGLLYVTLGCFLTGLVLYMLPKLVGERLGETAQGTLHVVRMAGQVIAFFLLAHTTAWHFRRWPSHLCAAVFALGAVLAVITPSYALNSVGFFLLGVGMGIGYTMSIYYTLALMRTKGLGSGLQESLIGTGNLFGPLYGGVIATWTSPRMSILAGLVPLAFVWLLAQYRSRKDDQLTKSEPEGQPVCRS